MKLEPLADRIVVKPVDPPSQSKGGILLPDTAKEKPQQGKVLAVGPGRKDDSGKLVAMSISVGDTVVYPQYAGSDFRIDDGTVKVLSEGEVLAKVRS